MDNNKMNNLKEKLELMNWFYEYTGVQPNMWYCQEANLFCWSNQEPDFLRATEDPEENDLKFNKPWYPIDQLLPYCFGEGHLDIDIAELLPPGKDFFDGVLLRAKEAVTKNNPNGVVYQFQYVGNGGKE